MAIPPKLTAIADAIRAKTGKSSTMTLDEMPTEIASISGGGGGFDWSQVCNVASMFNGSPAQEIDLTGIDTSNAKSFNAMFSNTANLKTVDLSKLDTSNATNLSYLFQCSGIKSVAFPAMAAPKVTTISGMFDDCASLEDVDLSKLETGEISATGIIYLFMSCANLKNINMGSGINTSAVTSISNMYQGCSSLEEIDTSWITSEKIKAINYLAKDCTSLKRFTFADNFAGVLMSGGANYTFNGCTSLEYLDMSSIRGSAASQFSNFLSACPSLKTLIVGAGYTQPSQSSNRIKFPVAMENENGVQYASGADVPSGAHTYTATE